MKNLHLKLAIGIIVVFGLLLLGFALYEPVWFKVQEWRLCSENLETRRSAVIAISKKEDQAILYIKKWLKSSDKKLVIGSCQSLELMGNNTWRKALPELKNIMRGKLSEKTDAAARVIFMKDYNRTSELFKYSGLTEEVRIMQNYFLYVLSDAEDAKEKMLATMVLVQIGDHHIIEQLIEPLIEALQDKSTPAMQWCAADALDNISSIMPDEFPRLNYEVGSISIEKQSETLKQWYKKHKHRLAWNPEKRKYFLKPEKNPDKAKSGQSR